MKRNQVQQMIADKMKINFQVTVGKAEIQNRKLIALDCIGQMGAVHFQMLLDPAQALAVGQNLVNAASGDDMKLSGIKCVHNQPVETCNECNTVTLTDA